MKLSFIKILSFITLAIMWDSSSAQSNNSADVEFQIICLTDSISPSQLIPFNRKIHLNNNNFIDRTFDNQNTYSPIGTVIPCRNRQVIKECWFRLETVNYFTRVIAVGQSGAAPPEDDDYWLVELVYTEKKAVGGWAAANNPLYETLRIPLAYPYGNTRQEAARFTQDLRRWLDCKGFCYSDDPLGLIQTTSGTNTGVNTPYPTLKSLRITTSSYGIDIYSAAFSRNLLDKNKLIIYGSATNTTISGTCELPFELYRDASNGQILYGINYKGDIVYPPFTLNNKRNCDLIDIRADHCDRPAGSNECWVVPLDSQICNYTLTIPANENITNFWIEGTQMISGPYEPDGGAPLGFDPNGLSDTLNRYVEPYYGKVSVDNRYNNSYGWRIHAKWSNMSFDSVQTNVKKYYFTKNGCKSARELEVKRNELGGILSTIDDHGDYSYLAESALKINCNEITKYTSCINNNRFRSEFLTNGTFNIDLSKYNTVSLVVLNGTVTYESINNFNVVNSGSVSAGFSEKHKSQNECEYFDSGSFIKLTIPSSATIKMTYLW